MEPVWIPSMTTELMSMVRLIPCVSIYRYRGDRSFTHHSHTPFLKDCLARVNRSDVSSEPSVHHGELQQGQHGATVVADAADHAAAPQHHHRPTLGEDHGKHR